MRCLSAFSRARRMKLPSINQSRPAHTSSDADNPIAARAAAAAAEFWLGTWSLCVAHSVLAQSACRGYFFMFSHNCGRQLCTFCWMLPAPLTPKYIMQMCKSSHSLLNIQHKNMIYFKIMGNVFKIRESFVGETRISTFSQFLILSSSWNFRLRVRSTHIS